MARGITETDVHTAADALVAAGERPTVERIRAHLGTGSPNTVTRWLETWWQKLGARLQEQQGRLAVSEAPEAVAALAGEWWAAALKHARAAALKALAADRAALKAEQEALQRAREDVDAEAASLREQVITATHAERLACARADELQRLAHQLEGQLEEMTRQRDTAVARGAEVEAARHAIDARLQALHEAVQTERAGLAHHAQAVEDRAHAEIDRARQENAELKQRLAALTKAHAGTETSLLQAAEQAKAAAVDANLQAGMERARADALEAQLAKLQDLPATLAAAMRRSEVAAPKRKAPEARPVPRSGKRAKVAADR